MKGIEEYQLDNAVTSKTEGNVVVAPDAVVLERMTPISLDDDGEGDRRDHKVQFSEPQPEPEERQQWDRPIEFLFSCIAMSVGLGNIWRFPFIAYENGGGAFFIPYLIVLFLVGKPIYFLEMSIGQFSSKGHCQIWQMAPFFKGVGYGATFGTACVLSYYCALMAITLFYLSQSFQAEFPWSVCHNNWEETYGVICKNNTVVNQSLPDLYFRYNVFEELDNIDHGIGYPNWWLAICLLVCWVCILLSVVKGVQSAGKVAYFTALFPYFVLIIFLIRGVTLPGAWEGIKYFIVPDWGKLLTGKVWVEAVKQCFFSMSIAFGPVITFASFNKFRHNIYKDAMIVSVVDCCTSVLAGVTMFAILGALAKTLGQDISKVAKSGPGLAFVSFPEAISRFGWAPQIFSVLFFLMLFTLGLGSATSMVGGISAIIHDKLKWNRKWIATGVCIVGFTVGLIYVTPGGLWMLNLVDFFGAGSTIYLIAIFEMVGMIFVYRLPNIVRDLEFMLGDKRINIYWQICWVASPLVLLVAMIYGISTGDSFSNDGKPYPTAAIVFGWLLVVIALSMIPLCALHGILQDSPEDVDTSPEVGGWEGFLQRLKKSFKPTPEWGPVNPKERREWDILVGNISRHPSLRRTSIAEHFIKLHGRSASVDLDNVEDLNNDANIL